MGERTESVKAFERYKQIVDLLGEATVKEVNQALQSNQPPSTPLPTDKKELSALVFELVGKVHMERQRT